MGVVVGVTIRKRRTNGGVTILKLLFSLPSDFQLFSELAAKPAKSGVAKLFVV